MENNKIKNIKKEMDVFEYLFENFMQNFFIEGFDEIEESEASHDAKEMGLTHRGFGRYSTKLGGPTTHKTVNGKLVSSTDAGTAQIAPNKGELTGKTEKEKKKDVKSGAVENEKKRKKGLTDVKKAEGGAYAYTFRWNGKAGKIVFTKTEVAIMVEKGLPPFKIILNRIEKKILQKRELQKSKEEKIALRKKKGVELRKLLKKYRQVKGQKNK